MTRLTFGSVCSGIEAASVAWHPLGWKAAWLAEIEPFPSAVLAHHYPEVQNLGDMTKIVEQLHTFEIDAPDILCGGTPCQAFSVAGLRRSLDDARGNLSLTFCEIANAIDDIRACWKQPPAIVFWENVPGVLSTKDNAFGCFLAGLAGEDAPLEPPGGKWTDAGCVHGPQRTVAWRTLDAQYFGLAQRRKRVFVVASARADFDPISVLFEFEGVRRDTAPSREEGQGVTGTIGASTGDISRDNIGESVVAQQPFTVGNTLTARMAKGINSNIAQGISESGNIASTLRTGGNDHADVYNCVACQSSQSGVRMFPANLSGTQCASAEDISPSMGAKNPTAVAQPMPINTMVALRHEALGEGTGFGVGEAGDPAYTLTKGHSHAVGVAVALRGREGGATAELGDEVGHALRASGGGGDKPHVLTAMQVRRLTPIECERLQGFPDSYTAIPWRGKPADQCPDGLRYKALGNSWAVPVVRWIGSRIQGALQ